MTYFIVLNCWFASSLDCFGLITPKGEKVEFRGNVYFSLLNYRWQEDACLVPPGLPVIGCLHMLRPPAVGGKWQCILFSVPAQRDNIWGPFLIISPASTLNNWHQEFSRFVPKFKVRIRSAAEWACRRKHLQESWRPCFYCSLLFVFSPLMNPVPHCACEIPCQTSENEHEGIKTAGMSGTIH